MDDISNYEMRKEYISKLTSDLLKLISLIYDTEPDKSNYLMSHVNCTATWHLTALSTHRTQKGFVNLNMAIV